MCDRTCSRHQFKSVARHLKSDEHAKHGPVRRPSEVDAKRTRVSGAHRARHRVMRPARLPQYGWLVSSEGSRVGRLWTCGWPGCFGPPACRSMYMMMYMRMCIICVCIRICIRLGSLGRWRGRRRSREVKKALSGQGPQVITITIMTVMTIMKLLLLLLLSLILVCLSASRTVPWPFVLECAVV